MNTSPWLGDEDKVRFSDAVEGSYRVSSRPQFFEWNQSLVHALVPHEILICGIEDGSRQGMALHRFSGTRYFLQEQFEAISDPLDGLLPRLLAVSERTGNPVVLAPAARGGAADRALFDLVSRNEMKNVVAFLVAGTRGKIEAFYAFARVGRPLDDLLPYIVELVVPHVHNTFLRVLGLERQISGNSARRVGRLITPRQEEILNLVKNGKTNSEIAELLSCSPWTIKNHIQLILRKLDSNTRTHAIARAMSLGILDPD
jgi:transcriptional regulator EpsA